jgi:hypothetical protein
MTSQGMLPDSHMCLSVARSLSLTNSSDYTESIHDDLSDWDHYLEGYESITGTGRSKSTPRMRKGDRTSRHSNSTPTPPAVSLSPKDVMECAVFRDFTRLRTAAALRCNRSSKSPNRSLSVSSPPSSQGGYGRARKGSIEYDPADRTRQVLLANRSLEILFPSLSIDLSHPHGTTCPRGTCNKPLSIDTLVSNFAPHNANKYTVKCPHCQTDFVPRFTVFSTVSGWEGSEGPGSLLWCELLSPWALYKEILNTISYHGIEAVTSATRFTSQSGSEGSQLQCAVLFWNLVVYFRKYELPFAFLVASKLSMAFILLD